MAEQYELQWRWEGCGTGGTWHELHVTGSSADVAVVMGALEQLGNVVTCALHVEPFPVVAVEPMEIVEDVDCGW